MGVLLVLLPVGGFVLTYLVGIFASQVWSRRLALVLTLLIPLGVGSAMLNRTFESGMLGALTAVGATLCSVGAWGAQFLIVLRNRNAREAQAGPGLTPPSEDGSGVEG